MTDKPRLIEAAFPLKQASIDSVHEKSVRHGHISTLHIWPARRPLAASRAALIAALLDDPGTPEARRELIERIGGKLEKDANDEDYTVGGVLRWGRERDADIDYFRAKIREKFGRAPRVLDPFSGGGAIPLEAMRMGCEATAVDINPVAWFILKCTLEYPQKLAGQKLPLPDFVVQNADFMTSFYTATTTMTKRQIASKVASLHQSDQLPGMGTTEIEADLAWHVRAWGLWVLEQAKRDLAPFYPVVDGKTSVAYLWARTVQCKECRATIPLLKTRWLVKKANKRVVLTMQPNADGTGVDFAIDDKPPKDETGGGTMSQSGATCPCCGTIMTSEDIRAEAIRMGLGQQLTAVVFGGEESKAYRLPTADEIAGETESKSFLNELYAKIPFGLPTEPTPIGGSRRGGGSPFNLHPYGLDEWLNLFTSRQLLAIGHFVQHTRSLTETLAPLYTSDWLEAIVSYLAVAISRLTDRASTICHWSVGYEKIQNTFSRFALSISWDFSEGNPISESSGSYDSHIEWIAKVIEHILQFGDKSIQPTVINSSSIKDVGASGIDLILTDPPYYDAIPYSDTMDFFYVWLRRTLHGLSQEIDEAFSEDLTPKWKHEESDGELIDDASRFDQDLERSKQNYESGMFRVFQNCHRMLKDEGRIAIVFANKTPDAWETLVSAIIRAGFVVTGSWPIQTEMVNRTRAISSAALSSSIWIVCRKRPRAARPGWDHQVIRDMEHNITAQLREFWDAGIRGPDFVWAATGPALEAYSQHPIVKKANEQDQVLTVAEFLSHVRRIVVDFMVGSVLKETGGGEAGGLDNVTNYYLLHRHDYGMEDAPINAVILYALSCSLSDADLINTYNLLSDSGSGSDVKLVAWNKRTKGSMGYTVSGGRPVPLIDKAHRVLHLWKAGDVKAVNEYIDAEGVRRDTLFSKVLQALIELAAAGSEERALLESISNHLASTGGIVQPTMFND